MYKITNALQKFFSPLTKYGGMILIVGLFIIVAYIFLKYYYPVSNITSEKFSDVANAERRDRNADVYFFFADWCPYCTKAKPEWEKLKDTYKGDNSKLGYNINFHDIDCSNQGNDNPEVASLMQTFGISSFPTVKLTTDDNKKVDYDAKVSFESLDIFLKSTLGN